MKKLLLFLTLTASAIAQIDTVKFNPSTNALIAPSAANFRTANSVQQSSAALTSISANTGTLSLSGVTLTLPAATSFAGARALLGSESGGNVTLTFPTSSNTLTVPRLAVSTAFALPVVSSDAVGLSVLSSHSSSATNPLLLVQSQNAGWSGSFAKFLNSAGTSIFNFQHSGNFSWSGTATGNGSGITTLNAANLASGTVPTARLGTGTANATTFLRGDQTWQQIDLTTGVTGVLPAANGGTGFETFAEAQFAFSGGFETELTAATEVDLVSVPTIPIRITGNTTIESFGVGTGTPKVIRFTGSPVLVHSANLVIPGGQNLQIVPGDVIHVYQRGSSAWQIFGYQPATGFPSLNGLTITSTTGTLTIANGKALTANASLTFAGTDGTTHTFPSTSSTVARTDAAQTFTGDQTFGDIEVGQITATTLLTSTLNIGIANTAIIGTTNLTDIRNFEHPDSEGIYVIDTAVQTLTNKTISGANNTLTVRLANDVTGTLPIANGGTGLTTLGTAGQVLKVNAGATALEYGSASGSGVLKSILGSAATSTSVTLAATGLSVAVEANSSYRVEGYVVFRSTASGTGVNVGYNSPSGTTAAMTIRVPINNVAAATELQASYVGAQGNLLGTSAAANQDHVATVLGVLHVGGTAGNVTIEFASETAATEVSVRTDSTLIATKL